MERREFIKCAALTGLLGRQVWAKPSQLELDQTDLARYDFILARIRFADETQGTDHWQAKPGGDANLLEAFSKVARCRTKPIPQTHNWSPQVAHVGQLNAVVSFDEPERLRHFPFLFMTGESRYRFNTQQQQHLRDFLQAGGFLLMDDCMAQPNTDYFFQSSIHLMQTVFGREAVHPIPLEHEIFHNVYDLGDIGLPFCNGVERAAYGVFVGNRIAALISSHDIHCGWCDKTNGTFKGRYQPNRGIGPHQHQDAIRAGVNIIMYAMSH